MMEPFKQGDLSGDCGLYAILNALYYCLELDEYEAEEIFVGGLWHLLHPRDKTKGHRARALFVFGFTNEMEYELLKTLAQKRLEIQVPFKSVNVSGEQVRQTLRAHVNGRPNCCAVFKLRQPEEMHWTVVHEVRNRRYYLLDSSDLGTSQPIAKFGDWHHRRNRPFAIHPPSIMLLAPAK